MSPTLSYAYSADANTPAHTLLQLLPTSTCLPVLLPTIPCNRSKGPTHKHHLNYIMRPYVVLKSSACHHLNYNTCPPYVALKASLAVTRVRCCCYLCQMLLLSCRLLSNRGTVCKMHKKNMQRLTNHENAAKYHAKIR